jgi:hypothetical protein
MRRQILVSFLCFLGLASGLSARADVGAIAVDAGAGASVVRVLAPYASATTAQVGSAPAVWIDGRYGLTNSIELTATLFAETSVPYYVEGTTIASDAGKLSGTLQLQARRYGVMAGVRLLHGNVWRLIVGADAGWALSSYSSMRLIDVADQSGPRDFGLVLPDTTTHSLILAPSVGASWVGDKISITVLPRFEALVGPKATWAISIPVTIGWDWYL